MDARDSAGGSMTGMAAAGRCLLRMLMTDATWVVIRPSSANVGPGRSLRSLLGNPYVLVGGVVFLAGCARGALSGNIAFLWIIVFFAAMMLAIGVHYRLYLVNGSLYARDGKLGVTDFLGRSKAMRLEDARALQLCSATYNNGASVQPYLLGMSRDNRCIFSIPSADHYAPADIRRVASRAGVPVLGTWEDVVALVELNHRFPGALSLGGRVIAGDWQGSSLARVLVTFGLVALIVLVALAAIAKSRGLL
ncbi:MAG: hypothetical protein M3082_12415 [Candidatus Dormibacteraeota bacterium]|nr:hypothetical protein [Candidatus Dormibacteraeota bacterium]